MLSNRLMLPKRDWESRKIDPNKESRIHTDTQEMKYMKET